MLSLQDSLQSSTYKGSTKVTHASRRKSASLEIQGQEVLSLQDALRCSTHLSIRCHHHKILRPTRNFLLHKWRVSEETRLVISRFLCEIFYKRVYEQKWYQKGLLIALLEESWKEYLQTSMQADSALMHCHEHNASGTPKIKMTARKGRWAISPDSGAPHPLHS